MRLTLLYATYSSMSGRLQPGEQRQYLERIDHATERLTTLVKEILDIAHLQADPLILQRAPVSFVSLVARLWGDLDVTGQGHRLLTQLESDLPPIEVDAARIGQVLENVVGSSVKYAPPESPITVGANPSEGWLIVSVVDEGVGIPESDRALVLEPFHRARNVRESSVQGTGLGLRLKLGADDCVTKPLSLPELMARIEAALRRAASAPAERRRRIQHRDLIADLDEHRVHLRDVEVHLTPLNSACWPTCSSTPASWLPTARFWSRFGAADTTPTFTCCA
jgi:hypothetical protein